MIIDSPKVFISYCWENESHKLWVRTLGEQLRYDGIDIKLDSWEAAPGDLLPHFMERSISENDFVLIICTPKYKHRADKRKGGVGYEGNIITGEMLSKNLQSKFIPLLCQGNWDESAPTWALGKLYLDFRGDYKSNGTYNNLLVLLYDVKNTPPEIGKTPEFIIDRIKKKL